MFLVVGAVPQQTALLFSQLVCHDKGYSAQQCIDQKNAIPEPHAKAIQARASTLLAWANTATTTVTIFTSLLLSRASDFYGRRAFMLVGIACALVGSLALGLVRSLPLLVGCTIFAGPSGHGINDIFLICIYSAMADVTGGDHPTSRTLGFGLISICYSCASILGPVGAGGLTHLLTSVLGGYIAALRATFLIAAAVYAALGAFVVLMLRETAHASTKPNSTERARGSSAMKQIVRDGNPVTMLCFLATDRVLLMVAAVFSVSHFAMSGTSGVEKLYQEYLFSWEALDRAYSSLSHGFLRLVCR